MTPRRLTWEIIRRLALWGFAGGGVLGAGYGLLLAAFLNNFGFRSDPASSDMLPIVMSISCLAGAAYGAMLGLILGLVEAVALSVVTLWMLPRLGIKPFYHRAMEVISTFIGGLGSLLIVIYFNGGLPIDSNMAPVLWLVFPILIAAAYGGWVGNRIATWVQRQATPGLQPSTT